MRIICTADLHGHLPEIPSCDLLIVAGDLCPMADERPEAERRWLQSVFKAWLEAAPARAIVGIAGNHDFVGQTDQAVLRELPWTYLEDESAEVAGLLIHGTPWTPQFEEWAYMLPRDELAERWALIPDAVDVLVSHCPPAGYGDELAGESIGSATLLEAIDARRPRLTVFGHVHSGYGRWQRSGSILLNAAHCDMDYQPAHAPAVVEL